MAKGYMVVHLDVTDPEQFEKYREKVPATSAKFGGRYLVRGGAMKQWKAVNCRRERCYWNLTAPIRRGLGITHQNIRKS